MPPHSTHLVDDEALALLARWIEEELTPPSAAADGATVTPLAPSSEAAQENAP
jgi:hypothetical protein